MNINDLLIYGRKYLLDTQTDNIPLKVRILLEHVLKMNKFELVIHHNNEISEEQFHEFCVGLEKIKNNVPIQYVTNHQEFMKLDFYVDENVLIPQPDTETIVEEIINYTKLNELNFSNLYNSSISEKNSENISKPSSIKILDLCTGSGAIAISLAKYIDDSAIIATDVSSEALQIAKLNAEKNSVSSKIDFIQSNMFQNIPLAEFDIIVSNPPYIETNVIPTLSQEVQREPKIALDGGLDGLNFYRIIVNESSNFLKVGGKLFLEIGYNQKDSLFKLIQSNSHLSEPSCIKDLSGNNRVIVCQKLY